MTQDEPQLSDNDVITPKWFAWKLKVSLRTAQNIFYGGAVPTVKVKKLRRMKYSTFRKHFLDKEV